MKVPAKDLFMHLRDLENQDEKIKRKALRLEKLGRKKEARLIWKALDADLMNRLKMLSELFKQDRKRVK